MKKILVIFILFSSCIFATAQEDNNEIQTILGFTENNGGFGAYSVRYSLVENYGGIINGGRGGWIINHVFTIGGGGYGFQSLPKSDYNLDGGKFILEGGYGGMLFEPTILPKFPIHLTMPIIIGAGGLTYRSNDEKWNQYKEDASAFFVVEPGLELELTLVKFFRIGFGAYYRYTSDIRLEYSSSETQEINGTAIIEPDALHGLSFGVTFKFGKF